jgi:hypothetical protein
MRLPITAALAAVASLSLVGCATTFQKISRKEDMLSAAGFTMKLANTKGRESDLRKLPPNKFVTRAKGDRVEYVYADPVQCNCLYIGDQKDYGAFRKMMFQKRLATRQEMTAMMYQRPWNWNDWDWGPWGDGWWQ